MAAVEKTRGEANMLAWSLQKDSIIQNLNDAGCSEGTIHKFMKLWEEEREEAGLKLLQQHRRELLDQVHDRQIKIDRLDFLLYNIRKQREGNRK